MPSFTPDSALELLFAPELIPNDVKAMLGDDLHMRPLAKTDRARGHLRVLSVLTTTPDVPEDQYLQAFNAIRSAPNTYFTIVIIHRASDTVVGVGSVFLEQKFTRGLARAGHIEDIAVDKSMQGRKLGLRIIQALSGISERMGSYKTILNCTDKNIPFYEKCGFEKRENEMAQYHSTTTITTTSTGATLTVEIPPSRSVTPRL